MLTLHLPDSRQNIIDASVPTAPTIRHSSAPGPINKALNLNNLNNDNHSNPVNDNASAEPDDEMYYEAVDY